MCECVCVCVWLCVMNDIGALALGLACGLQLRNARMLAAFVSLFYALLHVTFVHVRKGAFSHSLLLS